MELALLVYGISVLSAINGLLFFVCFCLAIMIIAKLVSYDFNRYKDKEELWKTASKVIQKYAIIFLVLSSITVLIPSQKTMYVMVGAYAAQKVAQSPETRIISEKVLKVIEKELDEQINEVKSTNK